MPKSRRFLALNHSTFNLIGSCNTHHNTHSQKIHALRPHMSKSKFYFLWFNVGVKWGNLIGSVCLGYENPQLFTTLNVMGDFFLLFDVTMDISHGKFISGQSGHTHHANFPFSTVKVSRVTAPIVKLFYEKTYRTMKHARIQSYWFKLQLFKQLWNLTFLTFDNDVWNIETPSNVFKFNFSLYKQN